MQIKGAWLKLTVDKAAELQQMSMKLQGQRRVAGSDSNQCTGPAVLTCRFTQFAFL